MKNPELISMKQISSSLNQASDRKEIFVLDHFEWELLQGDIQLISVIPGSGWRQFISILNGNLIPWQGEIYLKGNSIPNQNDKNRFERINQTFGFIEPTQKLVSYLTISENLSLPNWGKSKLARKYRINVQALLNWFELENLCDRMAGQLSDDATAKILFLKAFVHQPDCIVAVWDNTWHMDWLKILKKLVKTIQISLIVLFPENMISKGEFRATHIFDGGKIRLYSKENDEHIH
ncbi:MAG: ATP-binding cassette domain-containing protein [Anaerolineaceae bacterium]|nr:ATP-binding cassette domain-containing protein [Anaerolineaceae bacterium]